MGEMEWASKVAMIRAFLIFKTEKKQKGYIEMRSINPKKFSYEIVVDGCIQKLELEYSDEEAQVSFSGKSLQVNVGEIFKDTFCNCIS